MGIYQNSVIWMPGMKLDEVKKLVILKALEFAHNNKSVAANALGIHFNTLTAQLAEYEKEDEADRALGLKNQEEAKRILAHLRGEFTVDPLTGGAVFKSPNAPQIEAVADSTPVQLVPSQKKATVKTKRA